MKEVVKRKKKNSLRVFCFIMFTTNRCCVCILWFENLAIASTLVNNIHCFLIKTQNKTKVM